METNQTIIQGENPNEIMTISRSDDGKILNIHFSDSIHPLADGNVSLNILTAEVVLYNYSSIRTGNDKNKILIKVQFEVDLFGEMWIYNEVSELGNHTVMTIRLGWSLASISLNKEAAKTFMCEILSFVCDIRKIDPVKMVRL